MLYKWSLKQSRWVTPEEYYAENPPVSKPKFYIQPDIDPFVSPVDGRVITGRRALREHNERHGVTNVSDFKETWKQQAKEREQTFSSPRAQQERREALARAIDQQRSKRR